MNDVELRSPLNLPYLVIGTMAALVVPASVWFEVRLPFLHSDMQPFILVVLLSGAKSC